MRIGIIPACAGSTEVFDGVLSATGDHPRMCGEHSKECVPIWDNQGSSPHVRGAPASSSVSSRFSGIIPACAGSTTDWQAQLFINRDHPRMCGEHLFSGVTKSISPGSSPHVRGAHQVQGEHLTTVGIIPACAGSTTDCNMPGSSPHVRGAHFENSIIPRKRKDNWLFFIQFRFENFLAFRYLLALLHPFLGVPTKDPSFASLGRLINCNPSQSTGDQSAPYTLKAICCSFLAE